MTSDFRVGSYKVIREKSCGGRFLWNKNWDLGWIWAGSATFEAGFLMFLWAKFFLKNILDSENIFGIEWLCFTHFQYKFNLDLEWSFSPNLMNKIVQKYFDGL